jgi:signal transduction histidine kinase
VPVTSSSKPCVWVVDDSTLEARMVTSVLEDEYDVTVFEDGSSVIERIAAGGPRPELIVLDWRLPGISGIEVCGYLRDRQQQPMPAILMLSAKTEPEDIAEGLSSGADDYLTKPFEATELTARVKNLLRARALRDRAERAERQVRGLLEQLPDPLITVSSSGAVLFVNAAAEAMLGRPTAELLGQSVASVLPDLAGIELDAGGERKLPDVRIGVRTWAPAVKHFATGEESTTTVAFRDATAERDAAARRLDLYAIVAHDLRNPLSALVMRTDLLLANRRGPLGPEVRRDIEKMRARLADLSAMIVDLLDWAQLEGRDMGLARGPLELGALVAGEVEELRPLAEGRSQQLETAILEGVVVHGDPTRLRQVVSNLVSNALKFTPQSGAITVSVAACGTHAEVTIADTGPGIAADKLARVFERYVRAVDADHEVAGSGLGLMIVRQLVEAHGGTVNVESTPGSGSAFTFKLPLLPR